MRKKKLLFIDYIHSSVRDLLAYYDANLRSEYDDKIDIQIYKKKYRKNQITIWAAIERRLILLKYFIRPDLVIGDMYTHVIFKHAKKSMYMFHGALTKRHPTKNVYKQSMENATEVRKLDYVVGFAHTDADRYLLDKDDKPMGNHKFLPLGLPRNDKLFSQDYLEKSRAYMDKTYDLKGKKIVLYAPTYRSYSVEDVFPFSYEDFEKLDAYLELNDMLMVYRPHYLEEIIPAVYLEGKKNILILDAKVHVDTQQLLAVTDILITDYSSIYVDFLILNRPIAFIPFDLDYFEDQKGLVIDFKKRSHIPGPCINNYTDLVHFLDKVKAEEDEFQLARKEASDFYYDFFDNKSCKRIWDAILYDVLDMKRG